MSIDSKASEAEQASTLFDHQMDLLKTFFHLNNWLYFSLMEKWHGFMASLHHVRTKFHELRYRYHTCQVERADGFIEYWLGQVAAQALESILSRVECAMSS